MGRLSVRQLLAVFVVLVVSVGVAAEGFKDLQIGVMRRAETCKRKAVNG